MQAEVIAVGSELLTPSKLDTNSLYLARKLGELGIPLARKSVVGDDRALLADEIRRARESSDIVILSGGLGPTLDDLTRDASADATGRTLVLDESVITDIRARFQRFNRPMAEVNKRQAYLLEGARKLENPRGTAPGQWLQDEHGILILLPGPPRELEPMFAEACLPLLERHAPRQRFFTLVLRVAGIGESDLEQLIAPLYSTHETIATTILSAPGDVQVHLRAQADSDAAAQAEAQRLGMQIREILGDAVYSLDGPAPARDRGGAAHQQRQQACRGGKLYRRAAGRPAHQCPGQLRVFRRRDRLLQRCSKSGWLGVNPDTLRSCGAVSEQVAAAMAEQARRRAAEALGEPAIGVATTGYAGPSGGTAEDPVGTVYLGIADRNGSVVRRRLFGRGRHRIRALAVQTALDLLRRRILGLKTP